MIDSKYKTLIETLKKNILSGTYGNGNSFPSVRALIRRYGLSNTTVLHAMDELVRQGLVYRKQGRGTFVTCQGGSRKIGLVVPDHGSSEFFPPVVKEISRLAQEMNYSLLFGEVADESEQKKIYQVEKLAQDFIRQRVSGVIYQPIDYVKDGEAVNRRVLAQFDAARIPVVLCDYDFVDTARSAYDVVGINNIEAGAVMAKHLLSAGAKKVCLHLKPNAPKSHRDYIRGARSEILDTGKANARMLVSGPDDVESLRRFLKRWRPDAFICGNDSSAAHLRNSLAKLGVEVPRDILLAGLNDLQIAPLLTPSLTTIHLDCEAIAAAAFERLLARIANPMLPQVEISLPMRLVVRESTRFNAKKRRKNFQTTRFKCKRKDAAK